MHIKQENVDKYQAECVSLKKKLDENNISTFVSLKLALAFN